MPQVIAGIIVYLIVYVVIFLISTVIAEGRKGDKAPIVPKVSTGHLVNRIDSHDTIPLVYGRVRVGMNFAYVGTTGEDNRYLHMIGIIGEGPIHGIAQTDGVDQVFIDDALYTTFGSLVSYEMFTGTPDQEVCATLNTAIPEWTDCMRHTAYLYLKIEYDQNKFQKVPNITVEVEGLKVYNPATPTWDYSDNAALCALDYITRSSQRGGSGIGYDRLIATSITGSAAYCTAKGWTCNLPIYENKACVDNLTEILLTYRGGFIYSVTQFKMVYADLDYESSCVSIDEDDIVSSGKYSTLVPSQPSVYNTANAVRIKFLNKDNKYILDDYVLADSDAIANTGSYREETITIRGIDSYSSAMKMANYFLEKELINKKISGQLHARCCVLEAWDVFDVTVASRGWDGKLFRIQNVSVDENMNVTIEAQEEEEDFYNDTYDMSTHTFYDTTLPRPSDAVPPVINVSQAEEVYYYRDRSFTRWKISFDMPSASTYPWGDYVEVWIKIGAGDYVFMTKSKSDYVIDPAEEGETYYCKMVMVSIHGAKEDFNSAMSVSKTIVGKTTIPGNVAGFTGVASGDTVTLFAEDSTEPDLLGYEIRIGSTWVGALLFAFTKAPYIRLTGMKTGTFTFFIAAKDNAGHYCETPSSCSVTILGPASYSDKNTWAWDFSTGTLVNTVKTTHGGANVLGCSHTGGVLTGTWLSPEYDLGSKKKVRIYGDFLTAFSSSALTWGAVFPAGALWSSLEAGLIWADLLAVSSAGRLQATLYWGDSPGSLTNSADYFQILAVEVDAQYVQVEVTLIDPNEGSNLYLYTLNMKAQYWA